MYKKTSALLISCLAAVLLAALFFGVGCGLFEVEGEAPAGTPHPTVFETELSGTDYRGESDETPDAEKTFREATLYYTTDDGYIVPVKKLIPWEEGIARACLGYMISTPDNESAAAAMGLRTVLPAGTRVTVSISNGEAKLDLAGMPPLASAADERNMLTAVVDTLTEFSTVDRVTVTVNGSGGAMANGTLLPKAQQRIPLNIEESELSASAGASAGTLYFPNSGGALIVPVTRWFGSSPSLYARVGALISGPKGGGLRCCFPQGTLLLGAAVENGVVTVNLSEDFKAVAQTEGLYTLARESLAMTLGEVIQFQKLVIQVNGAEFTPETGDGA